VELQFQDSYSIDREKGTNMPVVTGFETINIGRSLREIRSRKGITQDELCKRARISINFLSQVENGRKGISHAAAERIAEALTIPISFLYLLADQTNNPLVHDLQEAVRTSLGLRKGEY